MSGGGPQAPTVQTLASEPLADAGAIAGTKGFATMPNYGGAALQGMGGALASMGGNSGYNLQNTVNYGNAESNMGTQMAPWAAQIMQMAGDPQNALYDRSAQRMQEQVRAGQTARGVAMTPYGANGEAEAMGNFNIDWQNNMLQRLLQGASGAGNVMQGAAGLVNQGQALAQSAPNSQVDWFTKYAAASPAAYSQQQQQIADYLSYLSIGTDKAGTATKNFTAQNDANSSFLGGIGKGIGTIASFL